MLKMNKKPKDKLTDSRAGSAAEKQASNQDNNLIGNPGGNSNNNPKGNLSGGPAGGENGSSSAVSLYLVFVKSEFKRWVREPLTRVMVAYPLIFGLIGRYLLPYIEENTGLVIALYADLILVMLTLIMPLIFGILMGFAILDDRDDNVLPAVKVTPLGLNKYFSFRIIMIFICTILACLFVILFSDIADLGTGRVISIAVLASLAAPMTGLFINIFASNKIEGFAIFKGFGTLIFFPIIALFFTDFKELFFAFAPGFFPAKAISSIIRGDEMMFLSYNQYIFWGWVYGIVLNLIAFRYFRKKRKI